MYSILLHPVILNLHRNWYCVPLRNKIHLLFIEIPNGAWKRFVERNRKIKSMLSLSSWFNSELDLSTTTRTDSEKKSCWMKIMILDGRIPCRIAKLEHAKTVVHFWCYMWKFPSWLYMATDKRREKEEDLSRCIQFSKPLTILADNTGD